MTSLFKQYKKAYNAIMNDKTLITNNIATYDNQTYYCDEDSIYTEDTRYDGVLTLKYGNATVIIDDNTFNICNDKKHIASIVDNVPYPIICYKDAKRIIIERSYSLGQVVDIAINGDKNYYRKYKKIRILEIGNFQLVDGVVIRPKKYTMYYNNTTAIFDGSLFILHGAFEILDYMESYIYKKLHVTKDYCSYGGYLQFTADYKLIDTFDNSNKYIIEYSCPKCRVACNWMLKMYDFESTCCVCYDKTRTTTKCGHCVCFKCIIEIYKATY